MPFSVTDPAAEEALAHLFALPTTKPATKSDEPLEEDEAASAAAGDEAGAAGDEAGAAGAAATTGLPCGLRALLAVPPVEMARWMVFDVPCKPPADGLLDAVPGADDDDDDDGDGTVRSGCCRSIVARVFYLTSHVYEISK